MPTGIYYSDACLRHDTGGHPESGRRLEAIMQRLRGLQDLEGVSYLEPQPVALDLVKSVHDPGYVDRVVRMVESGGGWLDADTTVSPGSLDAALHAVGGVVEGAVAVCRGELDSAFAAVRPPGHHATRDEAMGFCLFNNVAVAARQLLDRGLVQRVAILDFDVHHGNGTQDIFYEEPAVFYFSTHQMPLYPGTGSYAEIGRGAGEGYTVNVPLRPGVGDEGYLYVFDQVMAPALRRFGPEVILVSAGYDAHWQDQLASMRVTVPGFRGMVDRIVGLARELCGGRVVGALEGGYDLRALSSGVEATVRGLAGSPKEVPDPYGAPPTALGGEAVEPVVAAVRKLHGL